MDGYVHVYTGNGKGKTTAAIGLALRAAGAGLKVFIAQFVKSEEYSEINALKRFSDLITCRRYGSGCWIYRDPGSDDVRCARNGLEDVRRIIAGGQYDVVILDEADIATHYGLLSADDLIELINMKPANLELVFTGRYAHPRLIERADLCTEMREVKHYYQKGVLARNGIERWSRYFPRTHVIHLHGLEGGVDHRKQHLEPWSGVARLLYRNGRRQLVQPKNAFEIFQVLEKFN